MKSQSQFLFTSLIVGTLIATPATATTINFDDVATGTVINTHYAGVTFSNPLGPADIYATSSPTVATSPNVVSVFQGGIIPAFDARYGAVEAVFATGQHQVSIDAAIVRLPEGLGEPTNFPKLEIYNTAGAFVSSVGWDFGQIPQPPVGGVTGFETLSYTSAMDDIGKVRFFSGQPGDRPSNFGVFDNLVFTSTIPEPETYAMFLAGLGLLGWWMRRSNGGTRY